MRIKEPETINDSNDMLGYIICIIDKNREFKYEKIIKKMGKKRIVDFHKYIEELFNKKIIYRVSTDIGYLYPESIKLYLSPTKKKIKKTQKFFMQHF